MLQRKSKYTNARNAVTSSHADYRRILEEAWRTHLASRQVDALTVISLFAGCGGSSLGYSMAGFKELLAVEWDKNAAAIFRLNFPDVPTWQDDIAGLTGDKALKMVGLKPEELDLLDGSPPCQGFSTAGNRRLDDCRNGLFMEYIRLLKAFRPRCLVMENVSGMVKGSMKLIFAECLRMLRAAGYKVSARLMNTQWFLVPQSRERIIFSGIREDLAAIPSHPRAIARPLSTSEALGFSGAIKSWSTGNIKTRGRRIHKWSDGPAVTITATYGGWQMRIGGESRRPTIDEIMILSGFPLEFRMAGSFSQQWRCIGNTVPPLFMKAIAEHIRDHVLADVRGGRG